jgi:hypothetical protein
MAMQRVEVRLRTDQYEWLKAESKRAGRSMSAIVRDIVDRYLADDEMLPLPHEWQFMSDGRPMPNVVAAIRRSRAGH